MQPTPIVRPPKDSEFFDEDFLEAPDIEAVAEMLRERHNLPPSITFAFRWRKKGGKKAGVAKRGWCQKLSGPAKHFAGGKDFLIWLAADTCRDAQYTQEQYVALIYHELLFADVDIDPETYDETPVMRHVDFEGFVEEVEHYGLWEDNLRRFAEAVKQAPLFGDVAA